MHRDTECEVAGVGQPATEQGTVAGQLVTEMLAGAQVRHIELPTRLVVRHSTRPIDLARAQES